MLQIDGDAPEHQKPPQQSEEDAQMIKVDTIPLSRLYDSLVDMEAQGYGVWVGLWNIAQTLKMKDFMGM